MALTFADIKAEVIARGFDGLAAGGLSADTRAGRYVNAARAELDRAFLWPWREKVASGAAPLAISDLGVIESVQATTLNSTPLAKATYGFLTDTYGDLTLTGTPGWYYVTWTSGTPTVAVFPVSAASISVRYWRTPPDLTGTQTPLAPEEAHYTIVDLAVRRAYRDSDDHQAAAALQPEIDNAIAQLLESYPPGQADGPDGYVLLSVDGSVDS